MIYETVITTVDKEGVIHIAPMGITIENDFYVIAPFRPSRTLLNLQETESAVINMTDDVRIIAGCLTGRNDWPTQLAKKIEGRVLTSALSHLEVKINSCVDDELRPRFYCDVVYSEMHKAFKGFNRAQAAVLEAAILVSRLDMLAVEKIVKEISYLKIAIDKTAGADERLAWGWLIEKINEHYQEELVAQ